MITLSQALGLIRSVFSMDGVPALADGNSAHDPEGVEQLRQDFQGLPPAIRDALIARRMMDAAQYDRIDDWLVGFDQLDQPYSLSSENAEAVLHCVVEHRLRTDRIATWMYQPCQTCLDKGWDVPESWISKLEASLAMGAVGICGMHHREAASWFEDWREGRVSAGRSLRLRKER